MIDQLTLDDISVRKYPGFAEKVIVTRTQTQCSACHIYVQAEALRCPHCGALFLNGGV